jgi:hypothetical protein
MTNICNLRLGLCRFVCSERLINCTGPSAPVMFSARIILVLFRRVLNEVVKLRLLASKHLPVLL